MDIGVDPATAAGGSVGVLWLIREALALAFQKRNEPEKSAGDKIAEAIHGLALSMAGIKSAVEAGTMQTGVLLVECNKETRRCGDALNRQEGDFEVMKELLRGRNNLRAVGP